MIYYLVTEPFTHTLRTFLDFWAGGLENRMRIVPYEVASRARELPLGTYIFSDLERLLPSEKLIAEHIWGRLDAAGARLLNHPTRTLLRYELLTKLHTLGRNRFRVARATDSSKGLRFPVFLRVENDHLGSLSEFIHDARELDETITGARLRGYPASDILVVEYVDTSDEKGIYRKYSSFVVGGRVVACHIDCSPHWVVKDTDLVDQATLLAERRYVETNPHREWLQETFAIARVDYGRVDYSIDREGKPQVWEINTNPIVINPPAKYTPLHLQVKELFAERIRPAFEAIDYAGPSRSVAIEVPAAFTVAAAKEARRRRWSLARRSFIWHALRKGPVYQLRRIIKPIWAPFAPLASRWMRSRRVRNVFFFNCLTAASALTSIVVA